jgi:two-component system cell cycle response regulator
MAFSLFRKRAEKAEDKSLGISRKYVLSPGRSYVIEESPPDVSFDAFTNLVSTLDEKGKKTYGLMLTRQHPDLVRQKYGLESTSIYWLATKAGDGVISPTNLSILAQTMVKFAEGHDDGVILLDGVEYLISNNDFNKVLKMIDQVNDNISQSGSRLILPVDPRALDQKELALLQRNMERLELPGHRRA